MSKPGFFFYTGDWLKDTKGLSLEARGAWIDLLCALHEAGGSVTWPLQAFDQYWSTIERGGLIYSASDILDEFKDLNICTVVTEANGKITVSSRRMVRERQGRENNRERQANYREKHRSNGPVTPKYSASSSSESYSSSLNLNYSSPKKEKNKPQAALFVLPDWVPKMEWEEFKKMRAKMRKPLGEHAEVLLIKDLDRLCQCGNDCKAVIEQSIKNGWQGLFEIKERFENGRQSGEPKGFAGIREVLRRQPK